VGTPSARLANAEWLDVFARTADGALWDLYAWFTPPQLAYYFTEDAADNTVRYPSDPAVASWKPTRIDVFGRSGASRITRLVYDVYWSAWLLDVGLDFPAGELAAATREPAAVDLFVLARDGSLRHASWPRLPAR